MAHLLMLESWIGGTGRIFPETITDAGHRYTFVTRNLAHYAQAGAPHPVIAHATNVLTTETNDLPALIAFLRAQHAVLAFDGVVTICDYYVETVAQVALALGLPQAFPGNAALVRRKHLVRAALARASLPNPAWRVAANWEETRAGAAAIGYPLVLKPCDLASSAFVRLVHDEAGLHAAFTALENFPANFRAQAREPLWLLEAYMDGEEVSVEACTVAGHTTIIGITDKSVTGSPCFIEDGHMFPARLDETRAEAVRTLVLGALAAVGYDYGISHTEVKLTAQGARIVEINPRPGGNYIAELVERVTGIAFLTAQVDMALGRMPDLSPRATGVRSAAIAFLVPPRAGTVRTVTGIAAAAGAAHVLRADIAQAAGRHLDTPTDNACYLGHVLALDPDGQDARTYAQRALAHVAVVYAGSAAQAAPLAGVDALIAQVLAGAYGADPATLHVVGACAMAQSTRFPGTAQTYRNYYLLLRVGAAFGACCVERAGFDPDIAPTLAGLDVATLLADARLPVRIAALDAYLNAVRPHREAAQAQALLLPAGTPPVRAVARDQAIASLVAITPGQRVGLIGVVNPLVAAIEERGAICLPCDFNMERTQSGAPVTRDMLPVLEEADLLIVTGMTLSNGSFDVILAAVRRRAIPLIVYAQTGSGIIARFLDQGVSAISAEPFPFSQFSADPTPVYLYRADTARPAP